jgi:hypothetical protein
MRSSPLGWGECPWSSSEMLLQIYSIFWSTLCFTSKSNNVTKIASQRSSAQDSQSGSYSISNLDLSQITQTSQRGVGEMSQRLSDECFRWWNQQPPKEGGEKLVYCPPITSRWKLASRNQNIRFQNRNIQNLKYSYCRPNRNIWFSRVQREVKWVWPLCSSYLTWVFRLCWFGHSGLANWNISFFRVQREVKWVWPFCSSHLTWVFMLCWALRLCWQCMWYPSW